MADQDWISQEPMLLFLQARNGGLEEIKMTQLQHEAVDIQLYWTSDQTSICLGF
ncbi:hypothetical protein IEQ34_021382 [Dendrobium chrysotoxum]|uniref:Uncharacterized protein n=1 Tax=Dendrobium chrysotoxum TaxID=161865 RepID=A0AAV7FLQ5_DENCH|nr:hypothetical protein IEQ34_021382 [Dendrobium chrysotoxum]